MNKKIMLFCICFSMFFVMQTYQPVVSAQYIISIELLGYDKQGYFLYDIKNWGTTELEHGIINISVDGGGIWYSIDVHTFLLLENLQPKENRTFKTNEPIFTREQFRVFGRPLFGSFMETMEFEGTIRLASIHIFLNKMLEQYIPTTP